MVMHPFKFTARAGPRPAAAAPRAKIVVEDLWVEFGAGRGAKAGPGGGSVAVLENVNLSVAEGEFVCLVGPSGCGKSTLLNVVGGFLGASRGRVLIDGAQVVAPDPKRIYIFQENGVFPWLTVEENIGFGLLDRPEEERRGAVARYVEMVGLKGFEKAYPRSISGGMKQRVELARALAASPDVLYMDESFGALDYLTRMRLRAELLRIWEREKKTVLFVTHDVEEAAQLADRIVVMSKRPASILATVEVKLPRPRDLDSPEYLGVRDEVLELMGVGHAGMGSGREAAGGAAAAPDDAPRRSHSPLRPKRLDAEVIIVGGGPAGSVLGAYLARAGVDHLIVDKAHHPRAHVGESLSLSATKLLDELGLLPAMERESFVTKHGVAWTSWFEPEPIRMDYAELGGFDSAYQVDRARFDDLLLRHARDLGSRVFSGGHVDRVDFGRRGEACGVTVRIGESRFPLRSRLVVDASGRRSLLGRQLHLLRPVPDRQQFAVHSWFKNVRRGEAATEGFTHVHLLPMTRGWAWQIPINDEVTSVGVVTDRQHFVKSGEDVDQYFSWATGLNPILAGRMSGAKRLRELRMDASDSHTLSRMAGDGWLAAGDAAVSVDPIFSSGVSTAMYSAKLAAEAVAAALAAGDLSGDAFLEYERRMRDVADTWNSFVRLFYEVSPIFGRVVADSGCRARVLRFCEGEVYDGDAAETLAQLRAAFDAVRSGAEHPLRKFLPEPAACAHAAVL